MKNVRMYVTTAIRSEAITLILVEQPSMAARGPLNPLILLMMMNTANGGGVSWNP